MKLPKQSAAGGISGRVAKRATETAVDRVLADIEKRHRLVDEVIGGGMLSGAAEKAALGMRPRTIPGESAVDRALRDLDARDRLIHEVIGSRPGRPFDDIANGITSFAGKELADQTMRHRHPARAPAAGQFGRSDIADEGAVLTRDVSKGLKARMTRDPDPVSRANNIRHIARSATPERRTASASHTVAGIADLGPLIRRARKAMKLNQADFAAHAGVGRRFLSELEGGKPSLEFDKVLRCAATAGIDLFARPRHR